MPPDHLFVYGTLGSAFVNPHADLLRASAVLVGAATLRGRLYLVAGYPGAVLSEKAADEVRGELWRITADPAALLARLDAYEECTPAFPEPREYRRCRVRVRCDAGEVEAWTWLYNRPTAGLRRLPDGAFPPPG